MTEKQRLLFAFAPVFGALALLFMASVLIFGWLNIVMAPENLRMVGFVTLGCAVLVAAAWHWGNLAVLSACLCVVYFLLLPTPMAMFSYASTGLGAARPLFDADLASMDAAMGFDWLAALAWFNQWPPLVELLGLAYHGTIVPLIYLLVFLNVVGRHDRLVEFAWMFLGTCVLANILSGLWPAHGAYVHFRPDDALRSAISSDAGVWHLVHFEQLRAGTFHNFKLAETQGLVTFPSFHTAAALVIPIALRGYGVLTAMAWAMAATVLASTVPIGGHYLVDVVAGTAMTLFCFWLVKFLMPKLEMAHATASSDSAKAVTPVSQFQS